MPEEEKPLEGVVSQVKPWAIKAIPVETIQAITDAAHAERVTVGEWLARRVREWTSTGQVVRAAPPLAPPSDSAPVDSVSDLAAATERLAGIEGVPKGVMASMFSLVRDRARADRAALARQAKGPNRQRRLLPSGS